MTKRPRRCKAQKNTCTAHNRGQRVFTGLVNGLGRVTALTSSGGQMRLALATLFDMPAIALGESIAVNGVCLTVETFSRNAFTAYASAETLRATSLGGLKIGATVNLERALALGDRLGGHMVSGHVDCLAEVAGLRPVGESMCYELRFPAAFGLFVVPKGSVALDGISLTVNECGPDQLTVNIIPATQRETTIASWEPGHIVNMECDIIGKYVARMLGPFSEKAKASGITTDFLREHGF